MYIYFPSKVNIWLINLRNWNPSADMTHSPIAIPPIRGGAVFFLKLLVGTWDSEGKLQPRSILTGEIAIQNSLKPIWLVVNGC